MASAESLHRAILAGDVKEVVSILASDHGKDLINNLMGMKGTPLCAAIAANQPTVVQCLIDHGCDVNAEDYDWEPPLCLAISKGYVELADIVIHSKGCNVNKVDPVTRYTPLCLGILKRQPKTVQWLLEENCDVNIAARDDDTALHLAVRTEFDEVLNQLLEHGAKIDKHNWNGLNSLHEAAKATHMTTFERMISYINRTAGKHAPSNSHENVLNHQSYFQAETALHYAVSSQNLQKVQLLTESGCNVNILNKHGKSALHCACEMPKLDIVLELLKAGAMTNLGHERKWSVHEARGVYHKDDKDISGFLTIADNLVVSKSSPLHAAVQHFNFHIAKALLENGADVNAVDDRLESPVFTALRNCGSASQRGSAQVGSSALQIADFFLSPKILGKINIHLKNSRGENLLFSAMSGSHAKRFVNVLAKCGCDTNCQNLWLRAPLHQAVDTDLHDVVEELLENQACPNAIDSEGFTPLHLAIIEGLHGILRLLLAYGADVTIATPDGKSVLWHALDNEQPEVAELLIEAGCPVEPDLQQWDVEDEYPLFVDLNPSYKEWLNSIAKTPHTLKNVCRISLIKYFIELNIPLIRVKSIQLPQKLKDFLLMREYG